jgi:hypothetical protein
MSPFILDRLTRAALSLQKLGSKPLQRFITPTIDVLRYT